MVTRDEILNADFETLRKRQYRMQVYLMHMRPVPTLTDPEAQMLPYVHEHLAYLHDLEVRGLLLMSGGLRTGDEKWDGAGLAVLTVKSPEEARLIAENEPIHKAGLRQNIVQGWRINEGAIRISVRLFDQSFDFG